MRPYRLRLEPVTYQALWPQARTLSWRAVPPPPPPSHPSDPVRKAQVWTPQDQAGLTWERAATGHPWACPRGAACRANRDSFSTFWVAEGVEEAGHKLQADGEPPEGK